MHQTLKECLLVAKDAAIEAEDHRMVDLLTAMINGEDFCRVSPPQSGEDFCRISPPKNEEESLTLKAAREEGSGDLIWFESWGRAKPEQILCIGGPLHGRFSDDCGDHMSTRVPEPQRTSEIRSVEDYARKSLPFGRSDWGSDSRRTNILRDSFVTHYQVRLYLHTSIDIKSLTADDLYQYYVASERHNQDRTGD